MIAALRRFSDNLLGRSDAAITVPPFDGALKPNQMLEEAAIVAELEAPEDIAADGHRLLVADGPRVLQLGEGGLTEIAAFDRPVTALACLADGGLAVALDGREVRIVGGACDGARWDGAGGRGFAALNALSATADGRLLATDGSAGRPCADWSRDLMELGRSGRVVELRPAGGEARVLADGLAYAFGACAAGDRVWVSESWRHRVMAVATGRPETVLDRLPVYPSRLCPAAGGGFWLSAFTARTQLVEFVLREPVYRRRMMREIDPAFWVAPALTSGNTFLEPMQGAHIKTMGILKPWAPPRSYGLVVRLSDEGLPRYSMHSRVDGHNHGIVAVAELGDALYLLAKGPRRLLRLSIAEAERSLML